MTSKETELLKFEKLKEKATAAREIVDRDGNLWTEWLVMSDGPAFYSLKNSRGGQWDTPEGLLNATNDQHQQYSNEGDENDRDYLNVLQSSNNITTPSKLSSDMIAGDDSEDVANDTVNANANSKEISYINMDESNKHNFIDSPVMYDLLKEKNLNNEEYFQHLCESLALNPPEIEITNENDNVVVTEFDTFDYGRYQDIDFDSMYARSAVVRQRWPWTCLLDVTENVHFYRHEIDDFFQLDAPDGFSEGPTFPDSVSNDSEQKDDEEKRSKGLDDVDGLSFPYSYSESQAPPFLHLNQQQKSNRSETDDVSGQSEDVSSYSDSRLSPDAKYSINPNSRVIKIKHEIQQHRILLPSDALGGDLFEGDEQEVEEKEDDRYEIKVSQQFEHDQQGRIIDEEHHIEDSASAAYSYSWNKDDSRLDVSDGQNDHTSITDDLATKYAKPAGCTEARYESILKEQQWTSKRRGDRLHMSDIANDDADKLLKRLQGLKETEDANIAIRGETDAANSINPKDLIKLNILTDTLHKKNALRGKSGKTFLDTETLKAQILTHEWYQQLQRSREITQETLKLLDLKSETWLEHEIASRHLLEAVVMHRNALTMPVFGTRQGVAYPHLPVYLLHPSTIQSPKHSDSSTNELETLREYKMVDYRETLQWKIYTHRESKSNIKRIFVNKRSGVVQTGEPFDIRMKKSRQNIKSELWYHFQNISRKPLSDIDILRDEDGGLLFYHPQSDFYSPSLHHEFKHIAPIDYYKQQQLQSSGKSKGKSEKSASIALTFLASLLGEKAQMNLHSTDSKDILNNQREKEAAPLKELLFPQTVGYKHLAYHDRHRDIQASEALDFPLHNIWTDIQVVPPVVKVVQKKTVSAVAQAFAMSPTKAATPKKGRNKLLPELAFAPGADAVDEFQMYSNVLESLKSPVPTSTSTSTSAASVSNNRKPDTEATSERYPLQGLKESKVRIQIETTNITDKHQAQLPSPAWSRTGDSPSRKNLPKEALATTSPTAKPITVPPLLFEKRMPISFLRQYRDLILAIANSPRHPIATMNFVYFLLSEDFGLEAFSAYQYAHEIISSSSHGKQNIHDIAVSHLLMAKFALLYKSDYQAVNIVKVALKSCPESYLVLSHAAIYFHKIKYIEFAEQLFIGALMLDPLGPEALRGYAHLLIEKGDLSSAFRYLNRIPNDKSALYYTARLEVSWLHEMMGSDDNALSLNYTNLTSALILAKYNRVSSSTCHSYGHFHHMRGEKAKAVELYKRALHYNENNSQALLMMGCLAASDDPLVTPSEADAYFRRGLLTQHYHSSTHWLGLLAYGEFLLCVMKDNDLAEHYLWQAYLTSYSFAVWPTVALVHYYQYVKEDRIMAAKLLKRGLLQRKALSPDGHTILVKPEDYSGAIDGDNSREDDDSIELFIERDISNDEKKRHESPTVMAKRKNEIIVMFVATAFLNLDSGDDATAMRFAKAALDMDKACPAALRCLGLLSWRSHRTFQRTHASFGSEKKTQSLKYFNKSLSSSSVENPYILRQLAVVLAMEGNYESAYKTMEQAVRTGFNCALSYRTLGIMTYLIKKNPHEAVLLLDKAYLLSNKLDVEACKLKGQILLELAKYPEARASFQDGLSITPSDPTLLANLALSLSALGYDNEECANGEIYYHEKLRRTTTLRSLIMSQDPDELFSAAVIIGGFDVDSVSLTINNQVQADGKVSSLKQGGGLNDMESIFHPKVLKELKFGFRKDQLTLYSGVPQEILYLYGMYHMKTSSEQSLGKAKELFLEAIQRTDATPHPLALFMMGWLTELEGERRQAEQFYSYAAQLEPIDVLDYLRLVLIAEDTLDFVQVSLQAAIKDRHNGDEKKKSGKRKGKNSNNFEEDISEIRERLVMHERVVKLLHLRLAKMGKGVTSLHPPKKFVNIDPLWLERMFTAFSICDDWSWLLKSSLEFR